MTTRFDSAKAIYSRYGIDVEKAMAKAAATSIPLHWLPSPSFGKFPIWT